jgi:hypothetical protein
MEDRRPPQLSRALRRAINDIAEHQARQRRALETLGFELAGLREEIAALKRADPVVGSGVSSSRPRSTKRT